MSLQQTYDKIFLGPRSFNVFEKVVDLNKLICHIDLSNLHASQNEMVVIL